MKWTEAEILRLERAWSTREDIKDVAAELGRTVTAVQQCANRRGFGRRARDMYSLSDLERMLGYCRKTIARAIARLRPRQRHKRYNARWAISADFVPELVEELKTTRVVRA